MAARLPRFGCQGLHSAAALGREAERAASIGAHALPAKYNGVTVSRGSREQPRPSASRSARPCAMPRDLSASYSRCAARPSQNASHIIRTAVTAGHEEAGGGGDQPARFRSRWVGSKPSVASQFRNIFHAPDIKDWTISCPWSHANKAPGALGAKHSFSRQP
jgi:hypothetical protein